MAAHHDDGFGGAAAMAIDRFPAGIVSVPPSKSVSHRAAICAALAEGSRVVGLGDSDDISATVRGAAKIAAALASDGRLDSGVRQNDIVEARTIDCAESGSTLRFLMPLAAMAGGEWRFVGRGRLMERPQDIYMKLFAEHGARCSRDAGGMAVRGRLHAGVYRLPGDVSSQFVTGLLLALPLAGADSVVELESPLESKGYVEITRGVLAAFGVRSFVGADGSIMVPGRQAYAPADYRVEGDWSQAAFFLCAAALGRDVTVAGLGMDSAQGDRRVVDILREMGACVTESADGLTAAPGAGGLRGAAVDVRDIPDIVPPLAALACYANGETRFENAGRLRIKESDRLAALAGELPKLGADVRQDGDALVVRGVGDGTGPLGAGLPGGEASARGDHRIAMALAVAAIGCRGAVRLSGADCVRKSYPGFWGDFCVAGRKAMA